VFSSRRAVSLWATSGWSITWVRMARTLFLCHFSAIPPALFLWPGPLLSATVEA
jgi:hypothetical protein